MGQRRYTPQQEAARRKVLAAHQAHITAKATVAERIKIAFEEELVGYRAAESAAANEARTLGVTNTDVCRALGTMNWAKYQGILDLTRSQFVAAKEARTWEITWDGFTPTTAVLYQVRERRTGATLYERVELPIIWGQNSESWYVEPSTADKKIDYGWLTQLCAREIDPAIQAANPEPPTEEAERLISKLMRAAGA